MKKTYIYPSLMVEEVIVESGIAQSPSLVEQNGIGEAEYFDYGTF